MFRFASVDARRLSSRIALSVSLTLTISKFKLETDPSNARNVSGFAHTVKTVAFVAITLETLPCFVTVLSAKSLCYPGQRVHHALHASVPMVPCWQDRAVL